MRRHLDLHRLEADAQALQLVVVLGELIFQVGDARLEEDYALGGALGALDEQVVNVLRMNCQLW